MGTLYMIIAGVVIAGFIGFVLWRTRSGREVFKPRDAEFWKDENVYLAEVPDWMKEPTEKEENPEDDVDVDGKLSTNALDELGRWR